MNQAVRIPHDPYDSVSWSGNIQKETIDNITALLVEMEKERARLGTAMARLDENIDFLKLELSAARKKLNKEEASHAKGATCAS